LFTGVGEGNGWGSSVDFGDELDDEDEESLLLLLFPLAELEFESLEELLPPPVAGESEVEDDFDGDIATSCVLDVVGVCD
jgi:hypothetical protein